MNGWWREAGSDGHRALAAGMFAWMLDAFDVMLFALVLPAVSADLRLSKAEGGLLGSVMLVAAAAGGVAAGRFADRFGRTRALMLSIALYSVFTFLCGFANTLEHFVVLRVFLGFGMGGVWSSGASLVSESWPAASRTRERMMGWYPQSVKLPTRSIASLTGRPVIRAATAARIWCAHGTTFAPKPPPV